MNGIEATGDGATGGSAANDDKPSAPPTDDVVTRTHQIGRGRSALSYTATAGRIVLNEEVREDGVFRGAKPRAMVNVVSYVRTSTDSSPDPARPVTFAFNGGPGSSSVWLHLGLLGPRRVVSGDAGSLAAPPYSLVDNPETLLRDSDLVFIDPVSTSYSRPVDGEKDGEFHGFARDLDAVAEVIRLWTTRHDRWLSPKFLAGESYGATRAAALADALQQRYGMYLNGVVLISSILNFGTAFFSEGNDLPYWTHMPTYAAIAHFHGLRGKQSLQAAVDEARAFAQGDYQQALAQGRLIDPAARTRVAADLARITGLSVEYVERAHLRISAHRFFAEVLRARGQTVGRLDGRFTGYEEDAVRESAPESDPSYQAILGPYATTLNHCFSAQASSAALLSPFLARPGSLRYSLRCSRRTRAPGGRRRVRGGCRGPALAGGRLLAAEHTLAGLPIPEHLRANIEYRYYEAGHMMYVHEPSRLAQSADLARFVRSATVGR